MPLAAATNDRDARCQAVAKLREEDPGVAQDYEKNC